MTTREAEHSAHRVTYCAPLYFRCRNRPSLHTRSKSGHSMSDEVNKCSSVQGDEVEALAARPRRQRSAPAQFVPSPGLSSDDGDVGTIGKSKEGPTCWSSKEDTELTKLVDKYGNSWRDCLENSRIFQKKFKHVDAEAARDRLRSRWRVIRSSRLSQCSTPDDSNGFFSQHNDICEVCNEPGELLCCGSCNLVFHIQVSTNNES